MTDWTQWLALIISAVLVPGLLGLAKFAIDLQKQQAIQMAALQTRYDDKLGAMRVELTRELAHLSTTISQFQVEVARVYATLQTVTDMRNEVLSEIRLLSAKLDRIRYKQDEG